MTSKQFYISVMVALSASIALTACGGGGGGGSAGGGGGGPTTCPDDPSKCPPPAPLIDFYVHDIEDVTLENQKAMGIAYSNFAETGEKIAANNSQRSFSLFSNTANNAADANASLSATLNGLAVSGYDVTHYNRPNSSTDWKVDGALNPEGLTITQNVTLSRIISPTVTLTFDTNGNISGVTATYLGKDYTATDIAEDGITNSATNFHRCV